LDPKEKRLKRKLRARRGRDKNRGTVKIPRLCIYKSLTQTYAQLIDDDGGKTLISVSSYQIKEKNTKLEKAKKVGQILAEKAIKRKIKKVVFDRAGYPYHGRVKAVATGAREKGLIF